MINKIFGALHNNFLDTTADFELLRHGFSVISITLDGLKTLINNCTNKHKK